MIEQTVARWHDHLRGQLPCGLDELLADDCTFYSPIVFTPQRGKELTKLYLSAAAQTFPGERPPGAPAGEGAGGFRYTKQVLSGDTSAERGTCPLVPDDIVS